MMTSALPVSSSGWNAAPGVPCTQWSGHSVCGPYGNFTVLNGWPSCQALAKEAWPGGCQSWVSTMWAWRAIRRLTTGTTAAAPGTASAPPSQKSFCMSTTINASFGMASRSVAIGRDISARLFGLERGDPGAERAGFDGAPQAAHDVLVILQIVPRQQHRRENLFATDQMVQIGAAVVPARRAGALLVVRPWIVAMA